VPLSGADASLFAQRVTDGLETGCIYAALALAIVLVFRGTGMLNFAQGEMAVVSTYLTWTMWSIGLPLPLAVLASMGLAFGMGAAVERFVLRPVAARADSSLPIIVVTIGLLLAFNSAAQWIWGPDGRSLPGLFGSRRLDVGPVQVGSGTIGALAVLVAVAAGLRLLMNRTRIGLAMRAVACDAASSRLVGIRVGRVLTFGWGLAAALGALAGALVAPTVTAFDTSFMQGVLVLAFAAATIGGFDSLPGAIVGGLLIGVLESLAGGYVSADLKLPLAFAVILGVLLVRPAGLFGTPRVARV
jgi:branched-chain amino acid transport system permease protein